MAEKKNIAPPGIDNNSHGKESTGKQGSENSAATAFQPHPAATDTGISQKDSNVLDDEKVVDNTKGDFEFEIPANTDE